MEMYLYFIVALNRVTRNVSQWWRECALGVGR